MKPPFRIGKELLKKPELVDRLFQDVYDKLRGIQQAPSSNGTTTVVQGTSSLGHLEDEIENRALQDELTVTTAAISSGAKTSMSITAYGGDETRLFNNDPFVLVDLITGDPYDLQVNDATHVLPVDTTITFDSYTFPRDVPAGSPIYLKQKELLTNALRGGGDVDQGPLNVGTPGTPETVAGRARFKKAVNFGDPSVPATADGNVAVEDVLRVINHILVGTVAEAAWKSTVKAIQFARGAVFQEATSQPFQLGFNYYLDSVGNEVYMAIDEASRIFFHNSGRIDFQTAVAGAAPGDTITWVSLLTLQAAGGTRIHGELDHGGTTAGFFGVAPVTRPTAYTQTYATANKTLGAYTADNESVAYGGIDNAQAGTVYATVADLNALRAAYENLRAFTEDAVQMLNSVVDDQQALGLAQ